MKKRAKPTSPTEALVLEVIGLADYDLAKSFDPELSEDPEYSAEKLKDIIAAVNKRFVVSERKSK